MRLCFLGNASCIHSRRILDAFVARDLNCVALSEQPACIKGVDVRVVPRWINLRNLWGMQKRIIGQLSPDLIHVNYIDQFATVSQWLNIPTVLTPWGSDIYEPFPDRFKGLNRSMKWWLLRRTYRKARLVTALNRHVHDRLINRFGARPESIIPFRLGIPSPVEVDAVQMQQQRAKLGADSKTMVFFSARACRPLYNVKSIISGFLQTFLKEENVQLWVSTFGAHDEYLSSLKVLIADFPEKIRFVPPVSHDEMSVLISSADVVVSTPDSDGLPVTVMQSLAQGRPLIFSDLPQIRDLLVPFRHGLAIASPTPADIGAAMRELFGVGQGFGEMKDRCREKYASLPSADEEVDALVSAFRSIVEGRFH